MTTKEMVETLDNVGLVLFDFDIKGKQAFQMSSVLNALNSVRNEIEKMDRGKEETE